MRALSAAALVVLLCAGGCRGESGPRGDARKGGSITIGASSLPAELDPALAGDRAALQLLWAVYTPPLTYRHAEGDEGTELVPGLATSLPDVSEDGLTYSFRFRPRLSYSDGTPVQAGDFERAVDRARRLHSPLAALYRGVRSIEADERSGRVLVSLDRPDPAFAHALALPASAPVAAGTPASDLSANPPAGVGPYRIASARSGEQVLLRRVRGFHVPELPGGNVDEVALERFGGPARQARAVAAGTSLDAMQELPPPRQLPEIRSQYADGYDEHATASTIFLSLDPAQPPLHDRRLREAVSFAVDGPTLERLYAGLLEPGCNVLPSPVSGFAEIDPCPFGARSEPPDLIRSRGLVEEAGQEGTAVSLAIDAPGTPARVVRYLSSTLRKVGLAPRRVPASRRAAVTLRLLAPALAHPSAYLAGFRGRTGDRALDAELRRLLSEPEDDTSADAWADLDERLVEEALAAPLGLQEQPTFLSERMDQGCAVFHPLFGLDLTSLCLK